MARRAYVAIRPERQNVYEAGLQQAIGRYVSSTQPFITRILAIFRTTTIS